MRSRDAQIHTKLILNYFLPSDEGEFIKRTKKKPELGIIQILSHFYQMLYDSWKILSSLANSTLHFI